ncbi:HNH endonuclease domain-containing protein [Pedobacter nyackensis]|uniref:HNH endonuclease n=1 Tax=Pedobacter nyackensis TaxID=475255 RepID=A0A1W2EF12_9SPHI|nr:HNH endonuclease domain-containing protein [Pedobacter nyackensis]SMD08344.1 HNH endonuclease [Pedobacter nyackensis]
MFPPQPSTNSLPIIIAACFKSKSATYKYYWFIALLEELENGNLLINKTDLFASMIANAWYTINYFKLSYGKQDKLKVRIQEIIIAEKLHIDEKKSNILAVLKGTKNKSTLKSLRYFDGEVPYRFLSPWFNDIKGDKKEIYLLSQSFHNNCLYSVNEQMVVVNPDWVPYLIQNSGILKQFCYWNLSLYLQKHNPNVPDVPNKLFKAPSRNGLNKQRKEFWDIVIKHNGPIECVYTNRLLDIGDYAVEHFIPHAFVSHDLVWNLIPADKSFNSSKCDKLPNLEIYFEGYFKLQLLAAQTILEIHPNSKFLEDYLTFIPDLDMIRGMDIEGLKELFRNNIQPLVTIAANNGFEFMK